MWLFPLAGLLTRGLDGTLYDGAAKVYRRPGHVAR